MSKPSFADGYTRRKIVKAATAFAGAIALPFGASAQTASAKAASGTAKKPLASAHAPSVKFQALIDAAKKCGDVGEICRKHCIRLSAAGDVSILECMRTVSAMLPVCSAVGKLASQDAKRLKDFAKVCADVCADCEVECRKHEFHHRECKNCAEACASMVKACKALLAA